MCRSLVKKLKDCDIGVYATKSMRAPEFVQTQYKYKYKYKYNTICMYRCFQSTLVTLNVATRKAISSN